MRYYIDVIKTKQNNAAKKAPSDIANICNDMGMKAIHMPAIPYDKPVLFQKIWMLTVWATGLLKTSLKLKKGDILLIQHPLYGTKLLTHFLPIIKKKGVKLIAIIHDLNIIRGADEDANGTLSKSVGMQDKIILKLFDSVICHNDKMRSFLIESGFEKEKLISLEIFDYLCEIGNNTASEKEKTKKLVIAGNMSPEKSAYIYDLANSMSNPKECVLYLYGNGYREDLITDGNNISYEGSVSPDELPKVLNYDYGIIWDGTSIETCTGHTGEYLRFNNPHKTSLYLAAELPVIVWSEAAIADFVIANNVGIAVDNLKNIGSILKNISENEYQTMKNNTIQISKKLRSGYYFKTAYEEAVRRNDL